MATSIQCSNFSGSLEKIQYAVFNYSGRVQSTGLSVNIGHMQTRTASTHSVNSYVSDLLLNTGIVNQGMVIIFSTNPNMVCSAQFIDASAASPLGFDLRGIRFSPIPGTLER